MLMIAFAWVTVLLVGGGLALDHTLTGLVTRNFDDQLGNMLTAMVASAEIGPDGEVFFNRPWATSASWSPTAGSIGRFPARGTMISLALAVGPHAQVAVRPRRHRAAHLRFQPVWR
jgi:hypothetical protein